MIDQDLKRKLAQALGTQMFFAPKDGAENTESKGPLFERMFQGLALMNRLELIVTQSFQTSMTRNTHASNLENSTEEGHASSQQMFSPQNLSPTAT